jgi:Family of unknown function (DUF6489)
MKFQINIDCTPEEAREFFGLPDVLPMQQDLMEMVSRRLSENIQTMEPELLMKTWVPALFQGWTDVQSHFWEQFSQMGGDITKNKMNFNVNPSPKSSKKDAQPEQTRTERPKTKKYKK